MPQPLVSIIVPAYNDEQWVSAALQSCLDQTIGDIEVICVDDASTDTTVDVIESFVARDSRVRLIRNDQNRTAFQSRRVGVDAALANYALFLDADDELAPEAVEAALDRAQSTDADIVGFGVEFVVADGGRKPAFEAMVQPTQYSLDGVEILTSHFPPGKMAQGHVWGYLFRTDVLRAAYWGLSEDAQLPRANDVPLSFLALAHASSYASTPQRLYRYFFKRGTSGHQVRTAEDFAFYLGAVDSIELIADSVRALAEDSSESTPILAAYEIVRQSIIGRVLRHCVAVADDDLRGACFGALRDRVGDVDVIRAASTHAAQALPMLRHASLGTRARRKPVRNVVLVAGNLGTGGLQGVVVSQAHSLAEAGLNVTIAVRRAGDVLHELPPGVSVVAVVGANRDEKLAAWAEICRETRADVVVDHDILYSNEWHYYALVARAIGARTIGWVHNFALRPMRDDNSRTSLLRENAVLLEPMVTLSATDVAFWKLQGVENVVYLPNPPSPLLAALPQSSVPLDAPAQTMNIVWWGRLQQSTKQVRTLIPLLRSLRERGVEAHLTIIGPDGQDLTAVQLSEDAARIGVSDALSLPGPLHGSDLVEALSAGHIFVMTSLIEGSPLALVEAQAMGMPVAMYELPWLPGLAGNEGVISVRQGDLDELARQIALLSTDAKRYAAMSAASIEAAHRATSFDFGGLYLSLLSDDVDPRWSPNPTLADAQLLLEWVTFYAEHNAVRHARERRERVRLKDQLRAARSDESAARDVVGVLRRQDSESREAVTSLAAEGASLRSVIGTLRTQEAQLRDQNTQLRETRGALDTRIAELQSQLTQSAQELRAQRRRSRELREEMERRLVWRRLLRSTKRAITPRKSDS